VDDRANQRLVDAEFGRGGADLRGEGQGVETNVPEVDPASRGRTFV
jgi:hypothetical protein